MTTNLLIDPVFSVETEGHRRVVSLPELLSLLADDQVDALLGMRKHQESIFHVFLCQLAAMAMARSQLESPKISPDEWRMALRHLATLDGCSNDDPWTLLVSDVTQPGFMQPPSSNPAVFAGDFKLKAVTPDGIDSLQTAKNHDIKCGRGTGAIDEEWVYALISLQTSIGFLGAGNYGVARMNGGFGSRVVVGWLDSLRTGKRFVRDTKALLRLRTKLIQEFNYDDVGIALTWIKPWDGDKSLTLQAMDPHFIEVARRIRLIDDGGRTQAKGATSKVARMAVQGLNGAIGDPWIPITVKTNGALTVQERGFTVSLLRNLIFEDGYVAAAMQKSSTVEGDGWFIASVLVRGQGTTDGFHEAILRIPAAARSSLLGAGPKRDRLSVMSKTGLDLSSGVSSSLRYALTAFMEGGPGKVNMDKREIGAWVDSVSRQFHNEWSIGYFDWLWTTVNQPDDMKAQQPLFDQTKSVAERVLKRAFMNSPMRRGRTYQSQVAAEGAFYGTLYKKYRDFMEVNHV